MDKININGKQCTEVEALNMGLDYHKSGNFESAEKIYKKVYEKNPRNADCLHLSALILYHFGAFDSAIYKINRAINLKNNSPQYFYNKGVILLEKERKEEARKCFQKALEINPNYNKAKRLL